MAAKRSKRARLTGAGGLVLLVMAAGSVSSPAEAPPAGAPLPARPAEGGSSGLELRPLDTLAGSWSFEGKWQGADGKPARGNGVSQNSWILGGRYLQCDASALGAAGERVESRIVLGYDRRHQHYVALILDNQNSYYLQPTGSYRPATRSFVLSGKERDEGSGLAFSYRLLLRVEGPDRYVIEVFFDTAGPAPVSWFEAVYTRRGPSP